jgi:radical SAM superfamily enzyme YgiQ (UPF0313 family)
MNVLLLNPYISDFTAYDLWLRPLGLYGIAAVLQQYSDCRLFWLDCLDRFAAADETALMARHDGRGKYTKVEIDKPAIYRRLRRRYYRHGMDPGTFYARLAELPEIDLVLATSLMTYWHDGLVFTLAEVQRRFPRARVAVGGILPSLAASALQSLLSGVELVVGPGAERALALVAAGGGRVLAHPDLADVDNRPFPALELGAGRRIAPLLTAYGCPLQCPYCASQRLEPRFRERAPASVLAELERRVAHGASDIVLLDDALLVHKQARFMPIFRAVVQRGWSLRFHTPNGLHAREIDLETAELMQTTGFATVRLSFEAVNADWLRRSSAKVTVAEMRRAVANLERAGFARDRVEAYLLFGYPGQTRADVAAALEFAADLGIVPHLADYSPVPGTPDHAQLQATGRLATPLDLYETNKTYWLYEKSGFDADTITAVKERCLEIARQNGVRRTVPAAPT